MNVNIGGERLGTGAKMNVSLHNYNRSTHNLSKRFQSSMAPGVLYPAYVNIGLNGDKFDIDIEQIVRSLPTKGPLFSSYKLQIDTFVAPIRLYHGILHNNPINIGMKMNQVIFPKAQLVSDYIVEGKQNQHQVNKSNIWKYLGLSGLGKKSAGYENTQIKRKINALPLLAYYDIFKNYYANKQEDNAYIIKKGTLTNTINDNNVSLDPNNEKWQKFDNIIIFSGTSSSETCVVRILHEEGEFKNLNISYRGFEQFDLQMTNISSTLEIPDIEGPTYINLTQQGPNFIELTITSESNQQFRLSFDNITIERGMGLQEFPLENIDKMRELLLNIKLGEEFIISDTQLYPYTLCSVDTQEIQTPLCGLCVKTYQSDMFNNWIKSDTISGENGIAEITRVDTSNGLAMDALNLAQKVYNMLNRIAVTGGTYEDWQEAVFSYDNVRKAESPMYMGGGSSEIMFEEIIATTGADNTPNGQQSLGELGGRGKQVGQKGGNVKFTVEEPSIIMVIASLTPRISYSQGNKWYLTDLDTMDDVHKPALDGIGYQDLLVEQMAFTGSYIDDNGEVIYRHSAGKVPAWLNYMTDVDECYGDFADEEGKAFMVLNRNYDIMDGDELVAPKDVTTYIDPAKYNYAFAYNEIDAQNFWAEIAFKVTARRLMSAKQIPNL